MFEKVFWAIYLICVPIFMAWAVREQIRRMRKWRMADLKWYLEGFYKIICTYCNGSGYEGYTTEGDPNGEICESCESHGFVWRATFPPRWLKHSAIWRQSELEQLQKQVRGQ